MGVGFVSIRHIPVEIGQTSSSNVKRRHASTSGTKQISLHNYWQVLQPIKIESEHDRKRSEAVYSEGTKTLQNLLPQVACCSTVLLDNIKLNK